VTKRGGTASGGRGRISAAQLDVPADAVAVVEAAYRLDGTESEWLDGLARAASAQIDDHCGVAAATVQVDLTGARLRVLKVRGGPAELSNAVTEYMQRAQPHVLAQTFSGRPCTTIGAILGRRQIDVDPASQILFDIGIRDAMGVVGTDPAGYVVVLATYFQRSTRISRATVARWSRVASHLAAGFRVRRGLRAADVHAVPASPVDGSEAVLSPEGRIDHAEPAAQRARAALARAVLNVRDARGHLRHESQADALEAWKGLVGGRWSLIDHVDTDGKRFVVARKNESVAPHMANVTPAECRVMLARARGLALKLIAYDLGLSVGRVSKLLASGMSKVGIAHEAELAFLFNRPSRDE
jgi:DNA-binding CsgD family transcriptional regulator